MYLHMYRARHLEAVLRFPISELHCADNVLCCCMAPFRDADGDLRSRPNDDLPSQPEMHVAFGLRYRVRHNVYVKQ